jgi:FkbM family methyltransferase
MSMIRIGPRERLKIAARRALGALGFEIYRKGKVRELPDVLEHLISLGLAPRTVIDVGAADGTQPLYQAFPRAQHLLIEPLVEFEPYLQQIAQAYDAGYVLAAAGAQRGSTELTIARSPWCSSTLGLREVDRIEGAARTVPVVTLDDLCEERGCSGPYLIKADVEGGELEALSGASTTLAQTELALLEVSLFERWPNAPLLHDVVAFMKDRGFVAYDLYGREVRPLDGALWHLDVAFVKETGRFRQSHVAMSEEQAERTWRAWAR